jgi:hypothetical protein
MIQSIRKQSQLSTEELKLLQQTDLSEIVPQLKINNGKQAPPAPKPPTVVETKPEKEEKTEGEIVADTTVETESATTVSTETTTAPKRKKGIFDFKKKTKRIWIPNLEGASSAIKLKQKAKKIRARRAEKKKRDIPDKRPREQPIPTPSEEESKPAQEPKSPEQEPKKAKPTPKKIKFDEEDFE